MQTHYDYIEYYVGMAKMVVFWHTRAMGFEVVAYSGPETGVPDKVSYLLQKQNIRLLITAAYKPQMHEIVNYVDRHGNSVKRLAIKVADVPAAYQQALERGAIPILPPQKNYEEGLGFAEEAAIKLFDDNEILFFDNQHYQGIFKPGFKQVNTSLPTFNSQLQHIDHIACALRENETHIWEQYLSRIFDYTTTQRLDPKNQTHPQIGMELKVMQSPQHTVDKVLVSPDQQGTKTQIHTFLEANYGTGIQHLAFHSADIVHTVTQLRQHGVEFTPIPAQYYQIIKNQYPDLAIEPLEKVGILCEPDGDSLLLQVFTKPIGDRPTLFYEIIQRVNNYRGFGMGNIRALFEAIALELEKNNGQA
ncbi:MAG TPA: 4-hydroxyphenylpyruvate dioxygenase [Microscillaceae bacterium]|nr:4-hydroxyphenylpyruvate dioxygenase [Microscillaceae bacterium]